jgi:chemotaxis protein CheX
VTPGSDTHTLPHSDAVDLSIKEIFMSACGAVVEPAGEIPEAATEDGVIIAVISVMGNVDWSIYIGLPRDAAVAIAEAFCGFEIPFDCEDMGDAIGEVANIVAGNVKQVLDKRGVDCEISLPTVMRVDGLHVLKQRDSETCKQFYNCSLGQFWIGVVAGKSPGLVG